MYVYRVVCNIISLLSFWCLQDMQWCYLFYSLLFFICQSFYKLVNFNDHFEESILCCIDFLSCFSDFISLISAYIYYFLPFIYFIVYFALLFQGFWELSRLIWDFSSFLMYRFIAINVVLIPALALSYKFWYVAFSFKFDVFFISLGAFYLIYNYLVMY